MATHRPSNAVRDLILVFAATFLVFSLSYFLNIFAGIVSFLQAHPDKLLYADEVVTTLLTLSVGLAVFSWRRWKELRDETAERIKKQEELLRLTATQAEVERIISKQLHSDMDQMKEDVREILHHVAGQPKKKA